MGTPFTVSSGRELPDRLEQDTAAATISKNVIFDVSFRYLVFMVFSGSRFTDNTLSGTFNTLQVKPYINISINLATGASFFTRFFHGFPGVG
jgi:hypothetical protein